MSNVRGLVEAVKANFVLQGDGSYLHPERVALAAEQLKREQEVARVFEEEALRFMQAGFSLVCAMCIRLREGEKAGLDHCGVIGCKGPKAGGDFAQYVGPLRREYFQKFCLLCGGKAVRGVRSKGSETWFGLCGKHAEAFRAGNNDEPQGQEGTKEAGQGVETA